MTLAEALQEFDSVRMDGDNPVPVCCGLPVTMNGQDGTPKISCTVCGRVVSNTHRDQWVITNWGKGINLR